MKKQPRYILLNVGEVVQDGDEEFNLDENNGVLYNWISVASEFINETVQVFDPPVRRKTIFTE